MKKGQIFKKKFSLPKHVEKSKIYGAGVMGSYLKLGQIDHVVQIFQILEKSSSLLPYIFEKN